MSENIFRPEYRELTEEEKSLMNEVKEKAFDLLQSFEKTEKTREMSLAITKLEESVMWAVKSITK